VTRTLCFCLYPPQGGVQGEANPFYGKSHLASVRQRLSEAKRRGDQNPMFGKTPGSSAPIMVPSHAVKVYLYTLDGQQVNEFKSVTAVIKWLKVSRSTVYSYMHSGKPLNGKGRALRAPRRPAALDHGRAPGGPPGARPWSSAAGRRGPAGPPPPPCPQPLATDRGRRGGPAGPPAGGGPSARLSFEDFLSYNNYFLGCRHGSKRVTYGHAIGGWRVE
jgi:hypothetical protein